MYSLDEYNYLANKYGKYSSWAIWDYINSSNTEIINQNFKCLNSNYVLLGLNVARHLRSIPWINFHDNTHARKIRYACNDTKLRGAYTTDLFKGIPESNSSKFIKVLNDKLIEDNVRFFVEEMEDIKITNNSTFVIFGSPGSMIARCFDTYFKPHFYNNAIYYYHYAYYSLTDKQWVEGFWDKVGVNGNFETVLSKYKRKN